MYVCIYIYIYIYTHTFTCFSSSTAGFQLLSASLYTFIYILIYIYLYIYLFFLLNCRFSIAARVRVFPARRARPEPAASRPALTARRPSGRRNEYLFTIKINIYLSK